MKNPKEALIKRNHHTKAESEYDSFVEYLGLPGLSGAFGASAPQLEHKTLTLNPSRDTQETQDVSRPKP